MGTYVRDRIRAVKSGRRKVRRSNGGRYAVVRFAPGGLKVAAVLSRHATLPEAQAAHKRKVWDAKAATLRPGHTDYGIMDFPGRVPTAAKANPKRRKATTAWRNPRLGGVRRYRMGPHGEEPVWASKSNTAQMGREAAQQAVRHHQEPIHYGNMEYDRASAEEYHRLTGKYPSWHRVNPGRPTTARRSNPSMRVVFAPVNNAWTILYGDNFLDLDGQRFWPKKADLVWALKVKGLVVGRNGAVSKGGPLAGPTVNRGDGRRRAKNPKRGPGGKFLSHATESSGLANYDLMRPFRWASRDQSANWKAPSGNEYRITSERQGATLWLFAPGAGSGQRVAVDAWHAWKLVDAALAREGLTAQRFRLNRR